MVLLKCGPIAKPYISWVSEELPKLPNTPNLAIVMYGTDGGCEDYKDSLEKGAAKFGIDTTVYRLENIRETLLLVNQLNKDMSTQGILIMYDSGCDPTRQKQVMRQISFEKDVEGLHFKHQGKLVHYDQHFDEEGKVKCLVPATPYAVTKIIHYIKELKQPGLDIKEFVRDKRITIVNDSMRVGKPLYLMLNNWGATPVACHKHTPKDDLEHHIKRAHILIPGVPRDFSSDPPKDFKIPNEWINASIVIDVSDCGNIKDPKSLEDRVDTIYVPKTGKMTGTMMWVNLIYATKLQEYIRENPDLFSLGPYIR